jgi:DNA-binding CsgD family transcriptional regulator
MFPPVKVNENWLAEYVAVKPWNIPKTWEDALYKGKPEAILAAINRLTGSDFYMRDYFRRKMIIDSPASSILCGYSKKLAEQEGLLFFIRLFGDDQSEIEAEVCRERAFYNFLCTYPIEQRRNLIYCCDFAAIGVDGSKTVLYHQITPFQLDKNGNPWLMLCSCSVSSYKDKTSRTVIVDKSNGRRFDLIDGKYVLSDSPNLSKREVMVLKWMVKNLAAKQICDILNIPEYTLKRIKQRIYAKLSVNNAGGAIHKAHLMGII